MESIEYKDNNNRACKSFAGYILGIVGSTLSFIVCFMMSIMLFLSNNVFKMFFLELWEDIYEDAFMFNNFIGFENFASQIYNMGIVFLIIMIVGFILGLIGTIVSWHKVSFFSSSIMIIGGAFSIVSLVFPGVFLIIGGVLNMKCAKGNLNLK